MRDNPFTFWHLLGRSLLPSSASVIVGSLVTFGIVGTQVLLLSMEQGTLLPQFFGGASDYWTMAYHKYIVYPIDSLTGNTLLNGILLAVFWGLLGCGLYFVGRFVFTTLQDIRHNRSDVTLPSEARVVRHPLLRVALVRVLWRLALLVVAVLATFLLAGPLQELSVRIQDSLYITSLASIGWNVLLIYIGWMATLHLYTVLCRLFLFRTRIFSEIIE